MVQMELLKIKTTRDEMREKQIPTRRTTSFVRCLCVLLNKQTWIIRPANSTVFITVEYPSDHHHADIADNTYKRAKIVYLRLCGRNSHVKLRLKGFRFHTIHDIAHLQVINLKLFFFTRSSDCESSLKTLNFIKASHRALLFLLFA